MDGSGSCATAKTRVNLRSRQWELARKVVEEEQRQATTLPPPNACATITCSLTWKFSTSSPHNTATHHQPPPPLRTIPPRIHRVTARATLQAVPAGAVRRVRLLLGVLPPQQRDSRRTRGVWKLVDGVRVDFVVLTFVNLQIPVGNSKRDASPLELAETLPSSKTRRTSGAPRIAKVAQRKTAARACRDECRVRPSEYLEEAEVVSMRDGRGVEKGQSAHLRRRVPTASQLPSARLARTSRRRQHRLLRPHPNPLRLSPRAPAVLVEQLAHVVAACLVNKHGTPPSTVYTSKRSLRMHGGGEVGSVRVVSEDLEPVVVAGYRSSDSATSSGRHSECAALALAWSSFVPANAAQNSRPLAPFPPTAHCLRTSLLKPSPSHFRSSSSTEGICPPRSNHAARTPIARYGRVWTGMARESARNPASMERGRSSDDGGRSFGAKNGCRVDAEMDEEKCKGLASAMRAGLVGAVWWRACRFEQQRSEGDGDEGVERKLRATTLLDDHARAVLLPSWIHACGGQLSNGVVVDAEVAEGEGDETGEKKAELVMRPRASGARSSDLGKLPTAPPHPRRYAKVHDTTS
ncbi:hypothetical protein C8R44DRAFT_861940 [Mycena epipterygia]|nr:hypothetical protein C8R44DRAFT_861940 [Mycena epipterygia]